MNHTTPATSRRDFIKTAAAALSAGAALTLPAHAEDVNAKAFGDGAHAFGFELYRMALEAYDPELHRVALRCVEIYNAELRREQGEPGREGSGYFMEHVDAVTTEAGDGYMTCSPNDELFVLIFMRAAACYDDDGPRNHYKNLLALIGQVDAGADLAAMRDEREGVRDEGE